MEFLYRIAQNNGANAASFHVAEQYVGAFNKLAKTSNTLILPSNVGNVPSLVAEAMSIYSTITDANKNNKNNNNNNATTSSDEN